MKKKTYIILVNYRGWEDTIECLESIYKIRDDSFQVVVCDNGSGDRSVEKIREWAEGKILAGKTRPAELDRLVKPFVKKPVPCVIYDRYTAEKGGSPSPEKKAPVKRKKPPLVLIRSGKNLGFAGGNNVAIRFALARKDCAYLWLLNNDTVVPAHTLPALVKNAEAGRKENIGIVGSKIMHYDLPDRIQGIGGKYNPCLASNREIGSGEKDTGQYDRKPPKFDYINGASLFLTREFVETVGLMNEEYFLYFEELDWQKRAERAGWKSRLCPESVVYHKGGRSIGTNDHGSGRSELSDYFQLRNRVIFTRKYYPACLLTVILTFGIVLVNRILRLQFDRIPTVFRALFNLPRKKGGNSRG